MSDTTNPIIYIDGIGSSSALDTAGEIVDLKGLDISSLVGGPLNWEHKSDTPAQYVGKILKAKKIFSEEDCEDERQLMYWNHCKIPFLYVMGRLFNDKHDGAKQVAALFIDDHEHPHETPMVGFSVEGSKINKEGMIVTHSLARKMTITNCPANKTCIAKMIPAEKNEKQDDLESIFKSEEYELIDLQKSISNYDNLEKTANLSLVGSSGTKIGQTSSGHDIHSHAKVGDYTHFSAKDHHEAMDAHHKMAENSTDAKVKAFHIDKAKLHAGRRDTLQRLADKRKTQMTEARASRAQTTVGVTGNINSAQPNKKLFDPRISKSEELKNPRTQYHTEQSHAKSVSEEHYKKGKELGHTGSSFNFTVKGKGVHGAGFKEKEAADKFETYAKAHPATHSVKRSESHGHHFVDVHIKTPSELKNVNMKKAMTAGSAMAAPGQLTDGAALSKEDLLSDTAPGDVIRRMNRYKSTGDVTSTQIARDGAKRYHKEKLSKIKNQKSPNLTRAEEDYKIWSKREAFKNFMQKNMPHLTPTEIDVIGKAIVLNKSLKAEQSLESLVKNELFSAEHAKIVFSKDSQNEPNEWENFKLSHPTHVIIEKQEGGDLGYVICHVLDIKTWIHRILDRDIDIEHIEYQGHLFDLPEEYDYADEDESEEDEKIWEESMEKAEKPFHGYNSKKHSKSGGLKDSYRKKYNRETGSNLQRPVTGKVKKGSKAAKRRKSFCARMKGVSGPTSKDGKLTPKGAALKRWKCSENFINDLSKALKFPEVKPYNGPDATPRSNVPKHHRGQTPELKGVHDTEVEHVEPHYSGSHDAVYLKSGHRSEHVPSGKFKVGDKVTIRPHIQGTHILEHKK